MRAKHKERKREDQKGLFRFHSYMQYNQSVNYIFYSHPNSSNEKKKRKKQAKWKKKSQTNFHSAAFTEIPTKLQSQYVYANKTSNLRQRYTFKQILLVLLLRCYLFGALILFSPIFLRLFASFDGIRYKHINSFFSTFIISSTINIKAFYTYTNTIICVHRKEKMRPAQPKNDFFSALS